jgi:hypothetical protein
MKLKKFIVLFTATALIINSCSEEKKITEIIKPEIYGHWLLASLINYADSAKSILGHKQFFCTEIIISQNSDSVTIVNGDYEYWKTKCDSISETEMALEHLSHMPHSNLFLIAENKLTYYDSAAGKPFYFIKVPNNPIVKVNMDLPAIKYQINKNLFEHQFTDLETNKSVSFTGFNDAKGFKEFTNYQTFINNDRALMSDGNLMEFSHKKTKAFKLTIWEFKKDTLKIYTTFNTECKDCKPFYEKGVIWKTLLKK